MNFEQRFWAKVESEAPHADADECWNWVGVKANGYGKIWKDGRKIYSHRASFDLFVGDVPDDLCVLHTCDNRACVNPAHLFLGTKLDNLRDMYAKGRDNNAIEDRHPRAKLTSDSVRSMRALYATGNYSVRQLARRFGISNGAAWKAINGATWRNA